MKWSAGRKRRVGGVAGRSLPLGAVSRCRHDPNRGLTLKGHTEGSFRGLQPGRQDAGLGELGPDGQAVGRGRRGKELRHPQGAHWHVSLSVAFSPDGKTLASAS